MLKQQNKAKEIDDKGIRINRGIKSAVVGFVLTLLLFLLFSFLIYTSLLPEESTKGIVMVVTIFSAFSAGFLTSKNVPRYGLLNGMVSGLIYFFILLLSNMLILAEFRLSGNLFLILLVVLLSSALGGIVGINVRANRRSRRRK